MKKFEYKIVEAIPKSKWQSEMNIEANEALLIGMGLEGWELVQVYPHQLNNGVKDTLFFLRRPLPEEERV